MYYFLQNTHISGDVGGGGGGGDSVTSTCGGEDKVGIFVLIMLSQKKRSRKKF